MKNWLGCYWLPVKDGDPRVSALYRRHYSCYQYADNRRSNLSYRNRHLVMGPGEKLILMTISCDAVFGWRKFIDASGQVGVNCSFFRNEGEHLSSGLILEAERHAWSKWPNQRLYTYVNPSKIISSNPGYCFKKANWKNAGITKINKLIILEKLP